ncbi:DER1-domain-containing protein [Venturia nashicola]|uniref:Derlin n=1 Tax=Venturia nashicola TaxID=86259 RepID=A0A4Z1NUZ2_9PEZI|nr:DER1-domain-containing protein [Venturia nashicola]TLD30207.1 DER1-domain-containing protein [Venturia nashicola]
MAEVFWTWPPVTRTLTAATLALSVLVHSQTVGFVSVAYIPQFIYRVTKLPEVWRFITPFLITGPKFGILMDPYFLFTYGSGLERDSPRFTELGSFFVYVAFVMALIVALCGQLLGGYMFLQPLILAFAYTFSQDNPNTNITIYILTFPAKYLPAALVFLTFIMEGPTPAKHQLTGLVAAHAYDFLTRIWPTFGGGRNYIKTPDMVKRWFGGDASRPVVTRGYGTAVNARQTPPANAGWTGQRGPGRRLGGD